MRCINLIIWDKKNLEVFFPILIRWILGFNCEEISIMSRLNKKVFFSHLCINFIWTNQIWEKTNFGFECPILIRWISNRDCGKSIGSSTILRCWGFITPKTILRWDNKIFKIQIFHSLLIMVAIFWNYHNFWGN